MPLPPPHTHRLDLPVEGSDQPRQSQAQENVDGVGAVDVANGAVSSLLSDGRLLGGEGVRHGGPQGHQRDGGDRIFQANQAAEDGGQVAYDGGQKADDRQRHDEGRPAAEVLSWRDEGEENLREGKEARRGDERRVDAFGKRRLHIQLIISEQYV